MRHVFQCIVSAATGSVATALLFLLTGASPTARIAVVDSENASAVQASSAPLAQQQAANVKVDDSNAATLYANFARVTATPEEVIVDFAINPQPFAVGEQQVKATHRAVMNFYTTKRLYGALELTLKRHEDAFGPIELDVRKRAKPGFKDK